jgi:hypothetical protein
MSIFVVIVTRFKVLKSEDVIAILACVTIHKFDCMYVSNHTFQSNAV